MSRTQRGHGARTTTDIERFTAKTPREMIVDAFVTAILGTLREEATQDHQITECFDNASA